MVHLNTTAVAVSHHVKARLASSRVSEREAAKLAGISRATLQRRLAGSPFTLDELDRLAAILGTDAVTLLDEATRSAA